MNISIPEELTDEILTQFAIGDPPSDIVTFLIRHDDIKRQASGFEISKIRATLTDKLRSYDPTHRRFAEKKYGDKYRVIAEAMKEELQGRVQAFTQRRTSLLQDNIEKRNTINIELEAAVDDYIKGNADSPGLEIEDPGEAISVLNAIEKNRKLNTDDLDKLSKIASA